MPRSNRSPACARGPPQRGVAPANVYAARLPRHPDAPHTPLPPRTAMQVVFVTAAITVGIASL